jgi:translation initiation factor 3 subunit I
VTTTAAKAGGFEARFFHKIYAEEFGNVRGHFGPINTVAFSPDGRSFTTGGEDGYVRMHHFGESARKGGGGQQRAGPKSRARQMIVSIH